MLKLTEPHVRKSVSSMTLILNQSVGTFRSHNTKDVRGDVVGLAGSFFAAFAQRTRVVRHAANLTERKIERSHDPMVGRLFGAGINQG
jgi:hypothetical protein